MGVKAEKYSTRYTIRKTILNLVSENNGKLLPNRIIENEYLSDYNPEKVKSELGHLMYSGSLIYNKNRILELKKWKLLYAVLDYILFEFFHLNWLGFRKVGYLC